MSSTPCYASKFPPGPPDPHKYAVATVRFCNDDGSIHSKCYFYFVPVHWDLKAGNHIEVRTPSGLKRVRVEDVTGEVTGPYHRACKTAVRVLSRTGVMTSYGVVRPITSPAAYNELLKQFEVGKQYLVIGKHIESSYWPYEWVETMDKSIGQVGRCTSIDCLGVKLHFDDLLVNSDTECTSGHFAYYPPNVLTPALEISCSADERMKLVHDITKFKLGDRVLLARQTPSDKVHECDGWSGAPYWHTNMEKHVGKEAKVIKTPSYKGAGYRIQFKGSTVCWYCPSFVLEQIVDLEKEAPLAPAHDPSQFAVGDRVTITRAAENNEAGWKGRWVSTMDDFIGKAGTVVKLHSNPESGVGVRADGDSTVWYYPSFVLRKHMHELGKLKIGDKVRVARKASGFSNGWHADWNNDMDQTIGQVGTIVQADEATGYQVSLYGGENVRTWWYPSFSLEKVEDALALGKTLHMDFETFGGPTIVDYKTLADVAACAREHGARPIALDFEIHDERCRTVWSAGLFAEYAKKYREQAKRYGTFTINLIDDLTPPSTIPQPLESTMSTIKIETITYVNGQRVDQISEEALFQTIAGAEKEVERLSKLENKPAKIVRRIEEIKASIAALVTLIDERDTDVPKPVTSESTAD